MFISQPAMRFQFDTPFRHKQHTAETLQMRYSHYETYQTAYNHVIFLYSPGGFTFGIKLRNIGSRMPLADIFTLFVNITYRTFATVG